MTEFYRPRELATRGQRSYSRRELLRRAGGGAGLLGLAALLADEGLLSAGDFDRPRSLNPLAARSTHFPARAKSVIWIFINGGPSQVDTWDYKPALAKHDGQELEGFDRFTGFFANAVGGVMKSPFAFRPCGQSGKMVSEIFPHLGGQVDKMAFIHSGYTESNNHSPALFMMNCGLPRMGLPCVGSWVTYGLGSESSDLPAFVVMSDPLDRGLPKGHAGNWSAGFLPGAYQGTWLKPKGRPIDNLARPAGMTADLQQTQINFLADMNRRHLATQHDTADLAARIETYELAFRMQAAAPEALEIANEPQSIRQLYGLGEKHCQHFAAQCVIARRLVERGVRFVQIYSGGMENQRSWDGHSDIQGNHAGFARETDQPVAGLLADLQQRGLLDETLVIWAGEFGRLPVSQKGAKPGRDHNPHCFTAWLAGGGVQGGVAYGASDELGHKAATDRVHVNDLHATMLHLLGLDHTELTYRYNSREFRLTDVAGRVLHEIIA